MALKARMGDRPEPQPSVPTARDYIQDGLIAMWDGIENVGYGRHETNTSVWKNLIEGSEFPDFNISTGRTFGEDHLIVAGRPTAEAASAWSSNFTVLEIVYRVDTGFAFFCVNLRNRIMWGEAGHRVVFSGMGQNGQNTFAYQEFAYGSHNALTVFYASSGNAGAYQIAMNGEIRQPNDTWNQNTTNPSKTCIGGRIGVSSSYNSSTGIVNCIRLYNRAPSAAEIAANYAIDKARFNLP